MAKLETKQTCVLCKLEMTDFAMLVYGATRPVCMRCINCIKEIDFEKELYKEMRKQMKSAKCCATPMELKATTLESEYQNAGLYFQCSHCGGFRWDSLKALAKDEEKKK